MNNYFGDITYCNFSSAHVYTVTALICDVLRICARERTDIDPITSGTTLSTLLNIIETSMLLCMPSSQPERFVPSSSQSLSSRDFSDPWDAPETAIRCLTNTLCNDSLAIETFLQSCDGLNRLVNVLKSEQTLPATVLFYTIRLVYMLVLQWYVGGS